MTLVYGEIGPTGQDLTVTASGSSHDLDQCAAGLLALTPAGSPVPGDPGSWRLPLTWAAVTQLAHSFPGAPRWDGTPGLTWAPGPRLCDWLIAEIIRRSCEGDFTGEPPAREPMAHQRAAAVAIGMNGRFLLGDDTGTGKSGSYLTGLAELEARGRQPWPALFVCPAGVIDTVLEEIPQWYPGWAALAYRGSSRQRYLKSNARILVMGYETMRNDVGDTAKPGPLLKYRARSLVADEAHYLCNYDSLQSRQGRRLAAHVPNVIAGSGTPITRNAAGFWPVLNAMDPRSFPSRQRYKDRYCLTRGKPAYGSGDAEVTGLNPLREQEFRVVMQGAFRRVAKADVLDLPPVTYQTRYVEVPAAWRAAYDQMEEDMLAELPDQMTPLEANTAIVKMTRLRQLACSAADVETWREAEGNPRSPHFGQEVTRTRVTLKEPCWKGAALVQVLDELHQGEGSFDERGGRHGHVTGSRPVIAFAESAQLTRLAGAMAGKHGYAAGYIDGAVPQAERTAARQRFQANKLDLACVTTGAGGTGLNLTAADTMVFLAPPWGLVPRLQSEGRAHRRGQSKPVQVIDIVAKDTVEARVYEALRRKAASLAELVADRRIAEGFLGGGKRGREETGGK
jgi:SNF2 family DNA or RNA helicase